MINPQISRSDLALVFEQAEVYIVLGTAISTVGILAASFSLLRRRLDPLLLWFALFAVLYGVHLGLQHEPFRILGLQSPAIERLIAIFGFLVPIPAFAFFRAINLLGRGGTLAGMIVSPILIFLALATLVSGPHAIFDLIHSVIVTLALIVLVIALIASRTESADMKIMRTGLLLFISCAVYDNLSEFFGRRSHVEPFSLLILFASLGFVAGRRTLAKEQTLSALHSELEIAKSIQLSILPTAFPLSRCFQVAARYIPMTSVAGDFYDYLITGDEEAGLLIADVSGHGIPAALIASMVKLAATTQRAHAGDPASLLRGMNSALLGNTQTQYVTAAYVYLDAIKRELRYSAAGHPPMLILRNGEVIEVIENGLMLAAFDSAEYVTTTRTMCAGDRFLLYTDGILEATNSVEEEFGRERLHSVFLETAILSPSEASERIMHSIQHWSIAQTDDLTVLLCDFAD